MCSSDLSKGDGQWGVAWYFFGDEEVTYKFRCFEPGLPADTHNVHRTGVVPREFITEDALPGVVWNGRGWAIAHPDDLDPGDDREDYPRLAVSQVNADCHSVDAAPTVTFPELGVLSTQLFHDGEAHLLIWEGGDRNSRAIQFSRFGAVDNLGELTEPLRPLIRDADTPVAVWNPDTRRLGIAYTKWQNDETGENVLAAQFGPGGRRVGVELLLSDTLVSDDPVAATNVGDDLAFSYVKKTAAEDNPLSFVPLSFEDDGLHFVEPAREVGASLHIDHPGSDIAFDPINHVFAIAWIDSDPGERFSQLKVSIFDEHSSFPREVIRIPTDVERDADSPRIEWGGEGRGEGHGFELFWAEGSSGSGIFHAQLACPIAHK